MKFLKGFLITIQFFTAIPIKRNLPMDQAHLEKSIQTFPLVGLLQGLIYGTLLYVLNEWTVLSSLAIAFIVWLASLVVTGGLHIDGWMDMSDAYFSYQDKERRLEIMKDSRVGAFGVISLLVLLSSRFLFIYEIIDFQSALAFILIVFIPFLSKTLMGFVLLRVPSAKKDGMAIYFKQAERKSTLAIYPVYIILLAGVLFFFESALLLPFLLMILITVCSFFLIRKKTIQHFGGITGDLVGASVEGCENILWMTLWILHYFVMV